MSVKLLEELVPVAEERADGTDNGDEAEEEAEVESGMASDRSERHSVRRTQQRVFDTNLSLHDAWRRHTKCERCWIGVSVGGMRVLLDWILQQVR